MPAGFLDTTTALKLLQTKLQALQLNDAPAFNTVALFDMSNLLTALQELLGAGNRVCFVVHDQEQFENQKAGRELRCRQSRDITLLIADKNIANRQTALFGDGTVNTPGALALKDLVLQNLVGLLQPGMYCEPIHGEQIVLEKKVRDELQGRVAFMLGLRLVGGNVIIDLGQQPIP